MPTTKTVKKARNPMVKARTAKPGNRKAVAGRSKARQLATEYALPAAAMLGTGALTAAGVVMRERWGGILGTVWSETVGLAKHLHFARVLSLAGVERRRSFLSKAMPGLGGLALGLLSGAALTMWLAPKLKLATVNSKSEAFDGLAPPPVRETNHEPLRTGHLPT